MADPHQDGPAASGVSPAPAAPRLSARAQTLPKLRRLSDAPRTRAVVAAPKLAPRRDDSVVELRLALVCYGGVSLAIYMHGITKELEKLVVASRGFEAQPDASPFPPASVEHHYWQALKSIADTTGMTKRVVIDILAGTSAGGINGVFLAKALARGVSQNPLTDLWFTKGDIWKLLGGSRMRDYLHLAAFALKLPFGKAKPPLDGDAMYRWLVAALTEMDGTPQPVPGQLPLVPRGQPLQLFVTTTDYYGYRQNVILADPPMVTQTWNRDILEFALPAAGPPPAAVAGAAVDAFAPGNNPALAFAARATSSFPGAFPPFSLPAVSRNLQLITPPPRQQGSIPEQLFRRYQLAQADPEQTFFVDGGVLDNYPFRPAIAAIVKRSAAVEVERRLIYIDPAPQDAVGAAPGVPPSLFGTIWAGLSSLPSAQPIVDQLLEVRDFNQRVRFVDAIVAGSSSEVEGILSGILKQGGLERMEELDLTSLGDWRLEIEDQARQHAGYLYKSYFELRVASVVAQFSAAVSARCNYPSDSNAAYLVQLVIGAWARRARLLATADAPADHALQEQLLERFDLGFSRRRFAFVIQKLNQIYAQLPAAGDSTAAAAGRPNRADLNAAKTKLYEAIDSLDNLIGGEQLDAGLAAQLGDLFAAQPFPAPPADQPIDTLANDFLGASGARLDALHAALGDYLERQQQGLRAALLDEFNQMTAAWDPAVRRDVLVRYLGFPFWDALIYPTTRLSQAGELRELDVVRFSPADATTLEKGGAKAKLQGIKVFHFGAFFAREARENDYLWGRLDAADRIFHLLFPAPRQQDLAAALRAILDEERPNLQTVQAAIADLTARCDRLMT
jgi:patatin-related protein